MLIACVNVTNLFATRLAAREHEFAVRAALGAGRIRLARLALTESTLLAMTGGAVGIAFADAMLRVFVAMAPGGIPQIEHASLDARVLTAAFVASLAAGCVTGLWPTVAVLRSRSLQMRNAAPTVRPRLRLGLVSLQIALTVGMLGASSLLLRSLWKLAAEPLGFDAAQVLVAPVTLNAIKYKTPEQQAAFFEDLLARVSRMPGTQSAAVTDWVPPRGAAPGTVFSNIEVEGRPARAGAAGGMIPWRLVTPGFFEALHIPIVRGRPFQESDRLAAEPAMIVSESLARRLFPGEDPIGGRVRTTRGQGPWHIVVGIAKDIRDLGPAAGPEQPYYVVRPARVDDPRRNWRRAILIVRTSTATGVTASFLKQEIAALDPQLPIDIETMDQRLSAEANPRKFTASLVGLFATFALLLAVAGLSGTASYLVAQRTREIGVRMALGATPSLVARHVLAEAAIWIGVGTCGGIALAAASATVIRSQLVGVAAADPAAWSAAIVILAVALGAAVARPAIRAARTDPAITLRAE
jgi:predicted permease